MSANSRTLLNTVGQKMHAAVLENFNTDFVIKEFPIPAIGPEDVLLNVLASGLCGTDIHIQEGKIPTVKVPVIPGHETAGEVVEIGSAVRGIEVGDHVIVAIDVICGKCRFCLTGHENLCINLTRIGFERDGGHAEYLAVPAQVVHKIDRRVSPEEAAIIPDAVACMYHAFKHQGDVRPGDRVCILGLGGLGFQGIQIAHLFGADVYVTSRQPEKLAMAEKFGADASINTGKFDLFSEIKKITRGEMCDVVFDNIGIQSSIQQALDICRPGGKAVIVGYVDPTFTANYQDTMKKEKQILGMRGSTRQDLIESIHFVETGIIKPYIYKKYKLTEINEAIADLKNGKSLGRTVLIP